MGRKHAADPAGLTDRPRRNTDLVAPPGVAVGVKSWDGRLYPGLTAARVRDTFLDLVREQPRVKVLGEQQPGGAVWIVQRSRVFRFPDQISMAFVERPGGDGVVIYSASVYRRSDLGANSQRVDAWLSEPESVLGRPVWQRGGGGWGGGREEGCSCRERLDRRRGIDYETGGGMSALGGMARAWV